MCPRVVQTCEICKKVVSKYKCPSCLLPYCSLACFKNHKETPCAKPSGESGPSSTEEKPASQAKDVPVEKPVLVEAANDTKLKVSAKEGPMARPIVVEEENYVLEKAQFEAIASSSEIREALKDEALQKLIFSIDSSSNSSKELDEAMGTEAFREFTDKILLTISKSNDEQ
ncbi:hypothetical protein V5N11_026787 [Cardamine amara subsp. amara]|uniref:HIT-type domain-containing protein n=1 Tax=Cardamine amara subsp. amara TaxID=228776 RepID=A0ABD1BGK2_CARAN